MGTPPYDPHLWEARHWCIRNNITIAPEAKNETAWYIVIEHNGKSNRSPDTFGKTDIWTKIFEYNKYYYDKRKYTK